MKKTISFLIGATAVAMCLAAGGCKCVTCGASDVDTGYNPNAHLPTLEPSWK